MHMVALLMHEAIPVITRPMATEPVMMITCRACLKVVCKLVKISGLGDGAAGSGTCGCSCKCPRSDRDVSLRIARDRDVAADAVEYGTS